MFETSRITRRENPRANANILTRLAFLYTKEIYTKSKYKDLETEDIYKPINSCRSDITVAVLEKQWDDELKHAKNKSLTKVLVKIFGFRYFLYGLLNFIIKTPQLAIIPYTTGSLISYFDTKSDNKQDAVIYATILILCGIINSFYTNYYHYALQKLGLRIEIGISALIYRKSLTLTENSLQKMSSGRIMTIIAKDTLIASWSSILFLHDLWIGVLEICIVMGIMYYRIGAESLAGIVFFLSVIPIQMWIGLKIRTLCLKTLLLTDERVRRIQEILTSIRLIKLNYWELYFTKIVHNLRIEEMAKLRSTYFLKAINLALSSLSYRISYFLCVFTYYISDSNTSAEELFFLITCYKSLDSLLSNGIPNNIAMLAEGRSAIERIQAFLTINEEVEDPKHTDLKDNLTMKYRVGEDEHKQECGAQHGDKNESENDIKDEKKQMQDDNEQEEKHEKAKEYEPTHQSIDKTKNNSIFINLTNIVMEINNEIIFEIANFKILHPHLIALTGNIATGKSTLLKIIAEIIKPTHGTVFHNGKISYASQEPWIFPGTIRQNILFGQPYDHSKYIQVLKVCALLEDIEKIPEKDLYIVLDKGLNLSKGQQARINLARTVYKDADIYLLDDAFSSLDEKVAMFIFENCIKHFFKEKLCVLVTDKLHFLKEADKVFIIENKKITKTNIVHNTKVAVKLAENKIDENYSFENGDGHVEIFHETKVSGKVNKDVYKMLLKFAGGWKIICLLFLVCLCAQSMGIGFDYYANEWVDIETKMIDFINNNITNNNLTINSELNVQRNSSIILYGGFLVLFTVLIIIEFFSFFATAVKAMKNMHLHVFEKIMTASMEFYDSYYSGSIVSRFSRDMGHVDGIASLFLETVKSTLEVIVITILIIYLCPILCLPALIFFFVVIYCAKRFVQASRSLRRMELMVRAPCIGFINATLEGLTTIKAFKNEETLKKQFCGHQNHYSSVVFMIFTTRSSFQLWLNMIGNIFLAFVIFSFIFWNDQIENIAGNAGIAITQAMGMSSLLQFCVTQWAEIENSMTTVERIVEYAHAKQEENIVTPDSSNNSNKSVLKASLHSNKLISDQVPLIEGNIEFNNVTLKYPKSEQIILNKVSFIVKPKQKIGIIGRTGAGKSSIISTLFRLYKYEGEIIINGIDITKIDLNTLRSNISIIPQDPILFQGTIRSNLDPYGIFTDIELWGVLEKVGLKKMRMSNLENTQNQEEANNSVTFKTIEDDVRIGVNNPLNFESTEDTLIALKQETNKEELMKTESVNFPSGYTISEDKVLKPGQLKQETTDTSQMKMEHMKHKYITDLTSFVDEGGRNFSIGERQLLTLARILLSKNKIVVLDEATASVDKENSTLIQNLFMDYTMIIIAHKVDALMQTDFIITVEDGKIVKWEDTKDYLNKRKQYM